MSLAEVNSAALAALSADELAVLEAFALDLAARLASARASLTAATRPTSEAEWPADPDDLDLVDTATAAKLACRDISTIRTWARDRGIARRYGARWRVSRSRLKALVAAE